MSSSRPNASAQAHGRATQRRTLASSRSPLAPGVVAELTAVIPNLSEEVGTSIHGRMNRWAALGILARVHLNAEVYVGVPHYADVLTLISGGDAQADRDDDDP